MHQITTDVAQITTAEFSTSIVFTAPNNTTATIKNIIEIIISIISFHIKE